MNTGRCEALPFHFGTLLGTKLVHLGHDVAMRDLQLQHGRHGGQCATEELGGINEKLRVQEEDPGQAEIPRVQGGHELLHHRQMSVELNLSRAIKDEVVVITLAELLLQPVQVLNQMPVQ